ncbi:holo-ACP synthase [Sporolactobacillus nakayamae]|uniref:Holo-[acyl-carrier-protein] synthase n=1 Tax=Sporolactobacillus nakayamae TaxID=269670 RepID=A0A1I2W8G6_9BACL|nr:holo-ACP synthase [Sporolactobacillus nakayamae]SFG97665.1 holo-[acyl-carrier protein] synthase [Sporolactobacillus nakayamae]
MIKGIGVDLIELERIAKQIHHAPFINRVLTQSEREQFETLGDKRKVEYLAGHFSVKEAYAKARGTGIGQTVSFQDLTISYDSFGKPLLKDRTLTDETIHVSITHTEHSAAAFVIIESLSC